LFPVVQAVGWAVTTVLLDVFRTLWQQEFPPDACRAAVGRKLPTAYDVAQGFALKKLCRYKARGGERESLCHLPLPTSCLLSLRDDGCAALHPSYVLSRIIARQTL